MAGDWIPIRLDLDDDPRVVQMAEAIGIPETYVVGLLIRFWAWMSEHTTDGNAPTVTRSWFDRYVCNGSTVTGFCDALILVGWGEASGVGIRVVDFETWLSDTAKERAKGRLRVQKHRTKPSKPCNGATVTDPLPHDTTRHDRTEQKKEPVRTGTGDAAKEEFTGSDRKKEDAFRQLFAAKILQAIGCDDTKTQKVPLYAVANRIMFRVDREAVANEMLVVAKDKHGKGLRNPMSAWQKEIDKRWPPGGKAAR